LAFFSRYYDIAYPGDKLDLIAIPDFASGAMENLGAITFRETALLVDEGKATRAELERGDGVLRHVAAWKPERRRWARFTVSRAAAMQVDGLKSPRPIEFPVERPEEAAGMFDILTYEKGASVLRVLEQYLGNTAFRDGIRLYLSRHQYANAETTDLWDALEEATKQPARALMDSWIFQAGYPLISAKKDGKGLHLSQQIFRYLHDSSDGERKWHVPVFVRAATK